MDRDLDVQAVKRQREQIAIRHGLPPIGARMVNQYGIEWVVDGHLYAANVAAIGRSEGFVPEDPRDLLPVLIPQNLSQSLINFWTQVDRCTSKEMYLLDTLPYLRPHAAHPDGHAVDSATSPDIILFFLDAARVHETILAHEIAHLWVEFVDDCEDWRVLRDMSVPSRIVHLQQIQSFVLDQKVNQVIAKRGFDMSIMDRQYLEAMLTLGEALESGYVPKTRWEAAFDALYIACARLHWQSHVTPPSTRQFTDALAIIKRYLPKEMELSKAFIGSIERHGFDNRAAIRSAIDECLVSSYAFAQERFDLDKDLVEDRPIQNLNDKHPNFLAGLPVPVKLEIGKAMAKQSIGTEPTHYRITPALGGLKAQVEFGDANGFWMSPTILHTFDLLLSIRPAHRPSVPLVPPIPASQRPHAPSQGLPQMADIASAPFAPTYSPTLLLPPNHPTMPQRMPTMRRNYMPGVGLWLSRVRLAEQLAGEHSYVYAYNDPVNYIDPDGLWPESGTATCFNDSGLFCNHDPSNPKCPTYSHGMTGAWPNVCLPKIAGCCGHDCRNYNSGLSETVNCGSQLTVSKGSCSVTITIIDAGPTGGLSSGAIVDLSPQAAKALWTCLQAAKKPTKPPTKKPTFSCGHFEVDGVTVSG